MPVSSFVAEPVFDWTRPVAKPTRPKTKAKPRKATRKRQAKRRPAKRTKLSSQCRTVLIDRLEGAIEAGLIDLCDEDMPCESLDFTLAELAMLQRILFPEEYIAPHEGRKSPRPTRTAPGSAERIAEYAFRAATKRVLTVAGDATAHKAHERGLAIEQRKNGSGVRVVGWAEE